VVAPNLRVLHPLGDDLGKAFRCGDVNGDGTNDLCGPEGVDYGPPDSVRDVWFAGSGPVPVLGADLDGDGRDTLYGFDSGSIYAFPDGPGEVTPAVVWSTSLAITAFTASDLDSDGNDELLVRIRSQSVSDVRRIDQADLTGGTSTLLPIVTDTVVANMTTADFDGDGFPEIAIAGVNFSPPNLEEVRLYEQSGLLRQVLLPSGTGVSSGTSFGHTMATGDLDSDGFADLVVGAPAQDNTGAVYVINDPLQCP
jgi:hypothetical protein